MGRERAVLGQEPVACPRWHLEGDEVPGGIVFRFFSVFLVASSLSRDDDGVCLIY